MMKTGCKFCGTEEKVEMWVPAGCMCKNCRKNLQRIIKYKLGIPKMKIANTEGTE